MWLGGDFLPLWRCDFCFLHKKPLEKSGGTGPLVACSGWIQRLTNGSENNHKHNNKKKTSETYLDASSWRALYFPSRFLLRSSILTQFDWRRKRKSSGFDPDLLTLVWYIISVPLLFQTTLFQWHFDLARTADIPRWKKNTEKFLAQLFWVQLVTACITCAHWDGYIEQLFGLTEHFLSIYPEQNPDPQKI